MATEMITMKLDGKFLKDIDTVVKRNGYQNRTEFIRAALREKVDDVKLKEAMIKLAPMRGSLKGKAKMSDEEARQKAFEEISRKFK